MMKWVWGNATVPLNQSSPPPTFPKKKPQFSSIIIMRPRRCSSDKMMVVATRDRSKNRKPLQKGRNLSIEAIQAIHSLKRTITTNNNDQQQLEWVMDNKFRRLLKLDMIAVLRELLRQDHCLLALLVFEDIRKEYWYKPQVSLYAEIVSVLGRNGLFDKVEEVFRTLEMENSLEARTNDFNALLESLISFKITGLIMECFSLMKSIECDPDRSTFKLLVNYLESNGESSLSAIVRQEARNFYGEFLEFLEEEEETPSTEGLS